jgi:hypothetical protein
MNFEEFKAKVLKVGVLDITMQDDNTWMSFILADGTTVNLYTTEIDVDEHYTGWNIVQSEMRFMDGDLS